MFPTITRIRNNLSLLTYCPCRPRHGYVHRGSGTIHGQYYRPPVPAIKIGTDNPPTKCCANRGNFKADISIPGGNHVSEIGDKTKARGYPPVDRLDCRGEIHFIQSPRSAYSASSLSSDFSSLFDHIQIGMRISAPVKSHSLERLYEET